MEIAEVLLTTAQILAFMLMQCKSSWLVVYDVYVLGHANVV